MPRRSVGWIPLLLGAIVLGVGITVMVVIPDWGSWLRAYPETVLQQPLPEQARPMVQALLGVVLGPIFHQVGSWIRSVGYFVGSLLVVLSLFPLGLGLAILRGGKP